jgi:prepilin peptidase CpaA
MLAGLLCHALAAGLPGLAFSLAGLGAGLGLILGFHILGLMGAGDAKLMAAVGSVLGPAGALTVFLFSAVFGGAWALGRVALRPGGVRQMLAQVRGDAGAAFLSGGRLSPAGGAAGRTSMPYAPAVAAGVVAALAWTGLGHDYFSFF